jgi:hypothetical protein
MTASHRRWGGGRTTSDLPGRRRDQPPAARLRVFPHGAGPGGVGASGVGRRSGNLHLAPRALCNGVSRSTRRGGSRVEVRALWDVVQRVARRALGELPALPGGRRGQITADGAEARGPVGRGGGLDPTFEPASTARRPPSLSAGLFGLWRAKRPASRRLAELRNPWANAAAATATCREDRTEVEPVNPLSGSGLWPLTAST